MHFLRYPLVLFAGLLVLTGCTSTEVISTKDADFTKQIDKLYVFSRMSEALESYETSALDALARTMGAQSLDVYSALDTSVTDDATPESAEAALAIPLENARKMGLTTVLIIEERDRDRSGSSGTMMVAPGGGMMMGGGGGISQTYSLNASLYDVETEKRVWRAEIETKGDEYSTKAQEGRTMADSLMEKFVEDGLLPPNFNTRSNAYR